MKEFLKSKKGIVCIGAVALALLLLGSGFGIYQGWLHQQPKFHDLTVELGTQSISMRDFMTKYARSGKVAFVSDPAEVDLNRVGATELTLSHGGREETVTLTVVDTTAPTADFVRQKTVGIGDFPSAEEFVSNVQDEAETQVYFEIEPYIPRDYNDITVLVVVEDANGNRTGEKCTVSFRWIPETWSLEYGEKLTKEHLLEDPARDGSLLNQKDLDAINKAVPGTYELSSTLAEKTITCAVTVSDTTGPQLELKDVQVRKGGTTTMEKFIVSAQDLSGVKEVRLLSEMDFTVEGKQTVVIEAEDNLGNVTKKEAILWIATDFYAPTITGANKDMTVEKHSTPDFMEGVTVRDNQTTDCQVVVDTSKLDLSKAGTYYITYTATDSSGNTATVKRKIIVNHNEEDTLALVKSIADTLSDDPEELRDYVRNKIAYNTNWGGDDPVWYGFTKKVGNCYVHALCLKAFFDYKGIESQLIWVTNKTHYWLIVKIGDTWRHIDPTPGTRHTRYSLMDDEMRLATLQGRHWDTSLWPACE
ncbi:MAG: transglutaminase domain-containing protein [Oscillospiraceae bacterium]|nr:transglutaminase domain-containing protein [Oscillospiraceae bacterium]